jgi:hypothetical protein
MFLEKPAQILAVIRESLAAKGNLSPEKFKPERMINIWRQASDRPRASANQ